MTNVNKNETVFEYVGRQEEEIEKLKKENIILYSFTEELKKENEELKAMVIDYSKHLSEIEKFRRNK